MTAHKTALGQNYDVQIILYDEVAPQNHANGMLFVNASLWL